MAKSAFKCFYLYGGAGLNHKGRNNKNPQLLEAIRVLVWPQHDKAKCWSFRLFLA